MQQETQESPPFFSSWTSVYLLIVGVLLLVGSLFYLFTRIYE